jgi:flagellar biosynthesis chaperone FliJ
MGNELETLMTLRQRTLDEAESGLSVAGRERARRVEEHARAQAALEAARERVSARVDRERDRQTRGFSGGQWVDEHHYQARLREGQVQAEETVRSRAARVAQAQVSEDTARRLVLEARREVQVLEKHLEREASRDRRRDQRRAEKDQDDLALRHGGK